MNPPKTDKGTKTHELKCWPAYFADVATGRKSFEVRKNDRDYRLGDVLLLREFDPDKGIYTGDICGREIVYVLDDPQFVKDGYVILGLEIA